MRKVTTVAAVVAMFALPMAALAQEGSVRFPDIDPASYTAQQKEFLQRMSAGPRAGTITSAPFKVYVRSPEFGLSAIEMSNYLRWGTGLDARLSELAILIAARHWGSGYIWHAHYPLAVKGGLDPKIPAAIAAGQRPGGMRVDEGIIYDFLTEIYRDRSVADATFNRAVARFGEKGVTDIVGLASYYGITAMSLVAAKATFPPGDEPRLQELAQAFPR